MLSALLMILIVLFIRWHKSNMSKFRTFIKNQNDFTKRQLIQLLLTNFVVVFVIVIIIVTFIGYIIEELSEIPIDDIVNILCIVAIICGLLFSFIADFLIYKKYSKLTRKEKDDIVDISDVEL